MNTKTGKLILLLLLCMVSVTSSSDMSRPNPPRRVNLLVLLTDDQKVDSLGCYKQNQPLPTPNIDKLAADGIRFENGFVTTPICAVSRACILTGRYSSSTGMTKFRSVIEGEVLEHSYNMLLQKAGYYTGQLGKYGVRASKETIARYDFFDGSQDQGPPFRDYKGKKLHDSAWLTQRTSDFLDSVPKGKPFCLQVNYKAPHASSVPAPEDDHLLDDYTFKRHPLDNEKAATLVHPFVRGSFLDVCYRKAFNRDGDHNPFCRQYYEKIASVERSVGKIRDMLERRGLADNTVIIFLSDHGDHFGEKHLYGKWSPYEQSLRVPFIVYDPRPKAQKGVVRNEMVLNIDVAPTLLELAGVEVPGVMDGWSLVPLLAAGTKGEGSTKLATKKASAWRDCFFFEHYHSGAKGKYIARNEGIRTVDAKYLRWVDPPEPIEEVYDLKRDPDEINNLVNSPEQQERVEQLRDRFDEWRAEHPPNFAHDPYGRWATFNAPMIDWKRFKKVKPGEYEKIAREVKRLGVTWEQAMNDWGTRTAIWKATGYYY
ncbi:MAG: sulfatase-like hydrolase/transferase [Verrucomicrobia bacterium]|nr:sulfatase-like hydrolase/transferase [Verrucomicrobiota bacterium]MBT7069164.1 sulfatase-like hydrolase/transferase [Verrucomicrobiota bacterium]MBT7701694.1 sulfatase-like hydrolase/transferase [Verrucomicrobiota bacterium]